MFPSAPVQLVMDSMERHLYDRSLQTSGSACLYYVVDTFQNESPVVLQRYDDYLKRLLITILQAMRTHLHHSPVSPSDRRERSSESIADLSDDSKRFIDDLPNPNAPSQSYRRIGFDCSADRRLEII